MFMACMYSSGSLTFLRKPCLSSEAVDGSEAAWFPSTTTLFAIVDTAGDECVIHRGLSSTTAVILRSKTVGEASEYLGSIRTLIIKWVRKCIEESP